MPRLAIALALLTLAVIVAAPAQAAEPKPPLFAALGIETVDGRQGAVAAPLPDGRVLIAGGSDNVALRSAEIFDPLKVSFEEVPHLTRYARVRAVAAPLPDGRVLIAGGANNFLYAHAEIFDPETEEFSDVEDGMTTGRIKGMAAPLPDGRVLIAGGYAEGQTLNSAEVFDPVSETFTALGQTMWSGRASGIGVALPNGKVLLTGGEDGNTSSAEVFDPATGIFSVLNPKIPHDHMLAAGAALPNGQVLIAGGVSGGISRRWAGLLDSESGAFAFLPKEGGTQLTTARADAIAAPLPDGKVLISGGAWPEARSSAEIFVPAAALDADDAQLGTHVVGTTSPPTNVVVTSLGGWDLEIDDVWLGGPDAADFAIVADSCTGALLDFEETCTLSVRFTPSRLGGATASLVFDDNEPVPTDVPLTGTGVAPTIPGPPTNDPPLGPPAPQRKPTSVQCAAKSIQRSNRVKVTCRVNPGPGAWEARLRHRGRIVARRQVSGGAQRLTFRPMRRQPGGFRLQLVPLPS